MSKQVSQINSGSLSLMMSSSYHRVVSLMMMSCFFLILGGLEPILAYGFVHEKAEHAQPQPLDKKQLPEKNKRTLSTTSDFTDMLQISDLNCLSEQIQKNDFKPEPIMSSDWLIDLSPTTLDAQLETLTSSEELITAQEQVTFDHKTSQPTSAVFIAQPYKVSLVNNGTIAFVGPQLQLSKTHQTSPEAMDLYLVCEINDQPNQLTLKVKNNNQFSVLTTLPDYLKQSVNGGLSKARFQAQVNHQKLLVDLAGPSKPKKMTSFSHSLLKHECATKINQVNYRAVILKNIKTPTMSTGPPSAKASFQTFTHTSQPSLDQRSNPSCKQSSKLIYNSFYTHRAFLSLSDQDNLMNIINITG